MIDDYPSDLLPVLARFDANWPTALEVGAGWYPLLVRLNERLTELAPDYVVQQVKSKFGSLAFYATPPPGTDDDAFRAAVEAAEWASIETCEECGAPARQYVFHLWVHTLCADHAHHRHQA